MQKRFFSKIWFALAVLICIAMASEIDADDKQEMSTKDKSTSVSAPALLEQSESVLVEPLIKFSSNLFKAVKQDKQNVILSPLSVHSALNLLLLGAESNSGTETELLNILGYSSNTTAKNAHESYAKLISIFKEITAVGLKQQQSKQSKRRRHSSSDSPPVIDFWTMGIVKGGSSLMPSYLEQTKKYYNSSVRAIQNGADEESQKLVCEINHWAKEAGYENGIISQADLKESFSMLLLSAVRVQAFWFEEFYEHQIEELFYNHGIRSQLAKNATGMSVRDIKGKYVEFTNNSKSPYHDYNQLYKSENPNVYSSLANLEFRIIQIPLIGDLTFTIVEPLKNGTGQELAKLEEQLLAVDQDKKQTKLAQALELVEKQQVRQHIEYLQMPKFKFQSDIPLKSSLTSLGLKKVFGKEAELSKLSSEKTFVSEAKHQAVIEVNKMGIKAAGVTTIKVMLLSLTVHRNPIRVEVQNPFMFVLRYSKVPLFMGQLVHL